MGLVPGICTQCGATLSAEQGKQWMICPYCETPFLVKEAVEKFCITYNYNITDSVVHFHNGNDGEDFEAMCERAYKHEKVGAYENARKLWGDIVDKYPEQYEGWLGLIGYANFDGFRPNFDVIYHAITSLKKNSQELKNRIQERIIFRTISSISVATIGGAKYETWEILMREFPDVVLSGHQEAIKMIVKVGANRSVLDEMLGFSTLYYKKEKSKDPVITELISERRKNNQEITKDLKLKHIDICEEYKLPCVIGGTYFYKNVNLFTCAIPYKYVLDVIDDIIRIEKKFRRENGECVNCGRKLNIFKKCPKCK